MKKNLLASAILMISVSASGLEVLEDFEMSGVSGQAGLTLTHSTEAVDLDQFAYTEDGQSLELNGLRFRPSGTNPTFDSVTTVDIDADGRLKLDKTAGSRDFELDGISMAGTDANFLSMRGRYSYDSKLHILGESNGNYDISGSELTMNFDRLYFEDDGYEWILDDYVLSVLINYGHLVFDQADTITFDMGTADNRGLAIRYEVGAVGMNLNKDVPLGYDQPLEEVFGSAEFNLEAYGTFGIKGGGKTGEGITFLPALTLINDDDQDGIDGNETPAFRYSDDGFVVLAKDFRGTFSSNSGLTLDLEADGISPYLALRFEDLTFAFSLDDAVLGGDENDPSSWNTIGSFAGEANFLNDPLQGRENYIYLRPGGMVGTDGARAEVSWNIVSDDYIEVTDATGTYRRPGEMNTYLALNDNGNYVIFNGFNSYGTGQISFDITSAADNPVVTSGIYDNDYNGFYDGLRIGFNDLKVDYSFAGVTVGRSEQEAKESALMGGTELLLALEIFPSYDFTLNGNVTIRPGSVAEGPGRQGISWSSDLYVTNANAALTVDEDGRGVWLTGVNYDIHTRDASLDVTADGLTINKGLTWSTLSIDDIKFGDKLTGESLGSFKLERLEDQTTLSVASGGAGEVCIGGTLAECAAAGNPVPDENWDGGLRYEDRGDQGLTVKIRGIFVEDDGSDPRYAGKGNRFTWTQPNGTTLALDNFSTNDGTGDPNQNEYGLNVDLAIDVAPTLVRAKNDIYDNQGVLVANAGDLLGSDGLPIDFAGGDTFQDNAPLGFAVFGRVHFKQLNIDKLTLAATPESTPQTLIQGVVIQNADIQANLTATPIR